MMVVRSRLQLTLAILKPDLMMHPVRTKVRKVLVRFLRCPIHLFMRQSHIISHKIEWASEVEAYISLMWWACAEILPLLTPETFPCLVPDTPYTSLFLPPDIPLPSYPTSFSLFYPPPFSPKTYFRLFLTPGTFPYLILNTPYASLFLPQVHFCHLCLLTPDLLATLTCCDKIVIVSMIESEEHHKGQRLPCRSFKSYTAKPARSRKVLWRAQRLGT